MPALPRKTQQIFGSGLTPAGNIAVWGSLQSGVPAFSNDLAVIQSYLANWQAGLNGAVVGNRSPTIEDLNGLFLVLTQQIAYLLQSGIPEWDAGTTYFTDNYVRVAGNVYVSLLDDNLNNDPTVDTNSWEPLSQRLAPAGSTAKAWVNFDGFTGTILSSFNVASVTRTAAGSYTIAFINPMNNADYAVVGSCGCANGGSRATSGNNNHVSRDNITTVSEVSVWIPKPDLLFGEDAERVSVTIFGN